MNKTITVLHSGKAGDCIASLSFVKFICEKEQAKAVFYLDCSGGLESGDEETNNIVNKQTGGKGLNFPRAVCEYLKPLIEAQPYVCAAIVVDKDDISTLPAINYNLNKFRSCFLDQSLCAKSKTNLEYAHYVAFGYEPPAKCLPWLKAPSASQDKNTVAVARTSRYTSAHLWIASREQILKTGVFLGTEFEHKVFKETFDYAPSYKKTEDAAAAAAIISSSDVFVGNGSLMYWIAIGIGHPHIIHELCVDVMTTYYGNAASNITYITGGRQYCG